MKNIPDTLAPWQWEIKPKKKPEKVCAHKFVNAVDGCLICGDNWKQLNKQGYYFKAKEIG